MSVSSPGSDPPTSVASSPRRDSPPVEKKLTYQVIIRHLAKFRDGARHLLDLLGDHAPVPEGSCEAAAPEATEPEPKSPLEQRIERHMGAVDRALTRIHQLNPDRRTMAELPPEVRDQVALKERTIRDIVAAELHFWAAAIENAPLDKFDPIEQAWVRRMIRLAKRIGVDADHEEHLRFLEAWTAREQA